MDILIILSTFVGGVFLSAQASMNGKLSPKAGSLETALINFIIGGLFLAIIILFFGKGDVLALLDAPKWQLTGVFLGVSYLLLTILAVPKIGVTATSITAIFGQIAAGFVVDQFGWFGVDVIHFGPKRLIGLLLMSIALVFIFQDGKRKVTNVQ
ncbi:DMT family transporter [Priestia megaterium]|uniref:DMT family transporter n=1 Tax=Priestia megaterium TaxID=1404 RepID=UPI003A7F94A4